VSARSLLGLFDATYLLALSAWAGLLLVALLRLTLVPSRDAGKAGRVEGSLVRRLHAWGTIAGAVALPAYVAVPLSYPEYRGPRIAVQSMLILVGILAMLTVANGASPTRTAAGGEVRERPGRRIACLDGLMLVLAVGLLVAHGMRPAPRTSGLAELSATERAAYDEDLDRVIEAMEIKYGYRAGDPDPGAAVTRPGARVGEETIREIESYYREKRRRDPGRGGKGPDVPALNPVPSRRPTGQREGS
jgi:hypothetical protein